MKGFLSPQEYFKITGKRPRKALGQHFLSQPKTAEKIVRAAGILSEDVVVEVGPGLGILTGFVAGTCRRLHLVEVDSDLAQLAEQALKDKEDSVRVHRMDILHFDWSRLAEETQRRLVVLGNLPYHISSPLMFRLLEHRRSVHHGVFMVQREVGRRWAAAPGSKEYGVLSVLLSLYGRVEPLFPVGPGQFYPPPKVESVVVRIDFPEEQCDLKDVDFKLLRSLVNAVFQKRRKTLVNSLVGFHGLNAAKARKALEAAGMDPGIRPEAVEPEAYATLARILRTLNLSVERDSTRHDNSLDT
ncbi:MAG: 16S rRNA (adenine(1518)-N(6)/adenine(1519)-N(6))-dimethyltransferase RsmA [Desulfosoma sp.]